MDRDQNSSVHRKFIISLPISPSSHFIKIDSESDNSIKKDIINEDSLARSFYSIFPFAAYLRLFPDKRTDAEKQITDQTNYLPKSRIIMVSTFPYPLAYLLTFRRFSSHAARLTF